MIKQTDSTIYYAIAGLNGYGVYTDFIKSQEAACYIFNCEGRQFKDFEKAKTWAAERLLRLQPPYKIFPGIDNISSLNWCYFRKKY